jgi:hypothetical protein
MKVALHGIRIHVEGIVEFESSPNHWTQNTEGKTQSTAKSPGHQSHVQSSLVDPVSPGPASWNPGANTGSTAA